MRTAAGIVLVLTLTFVAAAAAQEKVTISEKIRLTAAPLPAEASAPDVKQDYQDFFKALEGELKAQAASFGAECTWNIVVKLVVKPKSKVIEIVLEPKASISPRVFTTGFARKAVLGSEEAFKESFKALAKTIISRAATCTT